NAEAVRPGVAVSGHGQLVLTRRDPCHQLAPARRRRVLALAGLRVQERPTDGIAERARAAGEVELERAGGRGREQVVVLRRGGLEAAGAACRVAVRDRGWERHVDLLRRRLLYDAEAVRPGVAV